MQLQCNCNVSLDLCLLLESSKNVPGYVKWLDNSFPHNLIAIHSMPISRSITFPQLAEAVCDAITAGISQHCRMARAMSKGGAVVTFKDGRWTEVAANLCKGSHKHFPGMDLEDVDVETEVAELISEVLAARLPSATYPDAEVRLAFDNGHAMLRA
jgi:hypothetical protein